MEKKILSSYEILKIILSDLIREEMEKKYKPCTWVLEDVICELEQTHNPKIKEAPHVRRLSNELIRRIRMRV